MVIFVVVLLVMGPDRIPEVARTMGRLMRDARRMMDEVTKDFTGELQEPVQPQRPLAVCTVCGGLNPVGNKYCGHCGRDMG